MKKIIFSFVMMLIASVSANAQVAREVQAGVLDNVSVSVQGGVTTPLDMNGVFPLNAVAGLRLAKEFTPIFGAEIEGNVWFNDNHFNRNWTNGDISPEVKTFVAATNVGLNGTVNLSNLFFGYKGKPRFFEAKAVAGIGWLHYWDKYKTTPTTLTEEGVVEKGYLDKNGFSAKTALNLAFNLDDARKHSVFVEPGVFWNLSYSKEFGSTVQFNQKYAQLALMVGYTYHFGCSNGTHHFVLHDVGALNDEINRLRSQEPQVVTQTVIQDHYVNVPGNCDKQVVITFAFDSAELSEQAKAQLDDVKGKVSIEAYASPEGDKDYNMALSQRRADAVAQYLSEKGATIIESVGCGVDGETSNRIAIVKVK